VGSRCLAAEVAKNLVLAGIGGVSLIDDSIVEARGEERGEGESTATTTTGTTGTTKTTGTTTTTAGEAAASGNFLVAAALAAAKQAAAAEGADAGEEASKITPSSPAAEAAAAALREMNPHVSVSVSRFSPSSSSPASASSASSSLAPGELAKLFEGAAAVVYACGLGGGSGGGSGGKKSSSSLPFSSLHAALAADAAASAAQVPFFWGGVAGSQGFFFVNLHEHEFEIESEEAETEDGKEKETAKVGDKRKAKEEEEDNGGGGGGANDKGEETHPKQKTLRRRAFASLERLLSHPWAGLHPRRTHALVYGLRTVFEWEARRAREQAARAAKAATTGTADDKDARKTPPSLLPPLPSASDLPLLLEAGHSLAASDGVAPHALPAFADDGALASLARDCDGGNGRQHPAVAAVVGGAMANDVIRAVSKKGAPAVDNLFCFSLADGKGVVERLGEVKEEGVRGGGGGGGGGGTKEQEDEEVEVV
jgi:hypothetical protein